MCPNDHWGMSDGNFQEDIVTIVVLDIIKSTLTIKKVVFFNFTNNHLLDIIKAKL